MSCELISLWEMEDVVSVDDESTSSYNLKE